MPKLNCCKAVWNNTEIREQQQQRKKLSWPLAPVYHQHPRCRNTFVANSSTTFYPPNLKMAIIFLLFHFHIAETSPHGTIIEISSAIHPSPDNSSTDTKTEATTHRSMPEHNQYTRNLTKSSHNEMLYSENVCEMA